MRVTRPPGMWPLHHLALASPSASAEHSRLFQDYDYSGPLTQILVSKEDEGPRNVWETLEQLSHKKCSHARGV